MSSILVEHFKNASFTKAQNRIAQYMIDHEVLLCRMSLMQLSKEIGVSDASVLRFVRHIGYDGFADFKEQLYQKLAEQAAQAAGNGKPRLRDRMGNNDVAFQIAAEGIISGISESLAQNTREEFDAIAAAVEKARTIYVCGARGTLAIAEHFARLLRFLHANTSFLSSSHDIHAALSGATKQDILLFFCCSRFYEKDTHICQAARSADVPVCLITNSIPSPLTPYASYILLAKAPEISFFNSVVGITTLAECLLMTISQKQGQSLQERLDSFDHFTQDERCH